MFLGDGHNQQDKNGGGVVHRRRKNRSKKDLDVEISGSMILVYLPWKRKRGRKRKCALQFLEQHDDMNKGVTIEASFLAEEASLSIDCR